jgi:hypothetical protein
MESHCSFDLHFHNGWGCWTFFMCSLAICTSLNTVHSIHLSTYWLDYLFFWCLIF